MSKIIQAILSTLLVILFFGALVLIGIVPGGRIAGFILVGLLLVVATAWGFYEMFKKNPLPIGEGFF